MVIIEADSSNDAVVIATDRLDHPEGVTVYNFEVEGDHTYFVEDGTGGQTAVWVHNTCAGDHHFVLRALASKTPYGHSSLTGLNQFRHTKVHRRLSSYLQGITKPLPNGGKIDMLPRKGNPGLRVQQFFSKAEREAALDRFYRTYNDGEYYSAYLQELGTAKANRWW